MSNRVQVRPSSSNCIISMGKSWNYIQNTGKSVSVCPRKANMFKEDHSHSDSKTMKIGRKLSSPQILLKILEKLGKKHTGHSSVQLPCVSYIVFVILFILLQKRFSLAMPGSNKHNSGKLHDK